MESLMRDIKVKAYALSGMDMDEYEEFWGLSKCNQIEVLLFTMFLGTYNDYERIGDKLTVS